MATAFRKFLLCLGGAALCVGVIYLHGPATDMGSKVILVMLLLVGVVSCIKSLGQLVLIAWELFWMLTSRRSPRKRRIEMGLMFVGVIVMGAVFFHVGMDAVETGEGLFPFCRRIGCEVYRAVDPGQFWLATVFWFVVGAFLLYIALYGLVLVLAGFLRPGQTYDPFAFLAFYRRGRSALAGPKSVLTRTGPNVETSQEGSQKKIRCNSVGKPSAGLATTRRTGAMGNDAGWLCY